MMVSVEPNVTAEEVRAEEPEESPLKAKAAAPAEPKPAETVERAQKTAPAESEKWVEPTLIRDLGEVAERISDANPMVMSFFRDTDCYVSHDRKKVTVKATNAFAVQMLSSDGSKKVLLSAFVLCGLCDADAVLTVTEGAKPKSHAPVDELTEF